MKYRKFGNTGLDVSVLGFGTMRLPTTDDKPSSPNIIEEEAIKMIRYAIDNGVNYIDTAYPYHGEQSEDLVGKALKDGYRERVVLASKCPIYYIKCDEDFDKYLNIQLEKLQTSYIDTYLIHALSKERWDTVLKYNVLDSMEKAKADGKIKHIGFSFHDDYDTFVKIVDGYDKWEFTQLQINYLDTEYQAGIKGMKYAHDKGLAVISMEPLRGGKLVDLSDDIKLPLHDYNKDKSLAEWAFDWVWNLPEISVALSGMSTMDQITQNLEYSDRSDIDMLSKQELDLIEQVQKKVIEKTPVNCTACEYCMPCPHGVNIPRNFTIYNDYSMYSSYDLKKNVDNMITQGGKSALDCIACKECESKCPQNICISDEMGVFSEIINKYS